MPVSKPTHRTRGKMSQKEHDDKQAAAFWSEAANHAASKIEKAAKIIRDTVITKKAAGRSKPTEVEFQRTTTQKSKMPIKKKIKIKTLTKHFFFKYNHRQLFC